jgi:hypothetical protein
MALTSIAVSCLLIISSMFVYVDNRTNIKGLEFSIEQGLMLNRLVLKGQVEADEKMQEIKDELIHIKARQDEN